MVIMEPPLGKRPAVLPRRIAKSLFLNRQERQGAEEKGTKTAIFSIFYFPFLGALGGSF